MVPSLLLGGSFRRSIRPRSKQTGLQSTKTHVRRDCYFSVQVLSYSDWPLCVCMMTRNDALPPCFLIWLRPTMLRIRPGSETRNEQIKPAIARPLYFRFASGGPGNLSPSSTRRGTLPIQSNNCFTNINYAQTLCIRRGLWPFSPQYNYLLEVASHPTRKGRQKKSTQ